MKQFYQKTRRLAGPLLLWLAVLLCAVPSLRAQTTLAQGQISIIGFNSNSPERGVVFVTWVDLQAGTVIKFTDNGFNNPTPSTNAGNVRWQEQELVWTASSAVAAGTVIRTFDTPPSASIGNLTMANSDGQAVTFWGLSNGAGDQIFAYQSTSMPAFTTTSTFSGTILFGLCYQGTSTRTTWPTAGPASSNASCLPSDLQQYNHIYIADNATSATYTGSRTGQTAAGYRQLIANPANWSKATGLNVTTIDMTNFSLGPPNAAIGTQPSASNICASANTSFTVTASNATGYQWQVDQGSGFSNITNGGVYSNATTATLNITGATAAMSGYLYRVQVTGGSGVISNSVSLTVNSPANITTQPSASTICPSANTSFSVVATGVGLTYQWQVNTGSGFTNISNGGAYSNATTATLNITAATAAMNAYQYRAVVTGTCTPAATSNAAALTINSAPAFTTQPSNSTICAGANTTFTGVTSGAGVTYQWQENTGSGFTNITNGGMYTGATSATLTLTGVAAGMNGYQYRLVASGTCSPASTSNAVTLSVNSAPGITSQPSNSTICAGANTTFTATASNATGYQWQENTGSGFSNISNGGIYSNATTASLTLTGATAAMNGYQYRVVVTGSCTPAATSNAVTLSVNSAPAITTQPTGSTICAGANTSFAATVSSVTGYQWQVNTGSGFSNVTNGGAYSNATTATLNITSATAGMNGYQYRLVATGSCTPAATSNAVTLTVNGAPSITSQPTGSTICAGNNTTFTATANNATGYQWQENTGSGFTNISNGGVYSNATTASLTLTGATAGMNGYQYRLVATGSCTPAATSNAVTLTVNSAPAVTSQPTGSTICAGGNTSFAVTVSNVSGYQWQVNTGSGFTVVTNGGVYSNATTATLNITGATAGMNGYQYRLVATGSCTPAATSNAVTLTVNGAPSISTQPTGSTICAGNNTTFTVTASNTTGYQWQVNTGSGFSNITNGGVYSNATTATLTLTGATAGMNGYQYRVVATGSCTPAATSNAVTLTINSAPAITTQPSNSSIIAGANTSFSAAAQNATAYQWQVNTGAGFSNITNGGVYSNATTTTLNISGATLGMNAYQYRLIANGACSPAATSNAATLTVNPSTNASLSGLSISSGTLSPNFATGTYSYTAMVTTSVSGITIMPAAANSAAVIRINGNIVSSGNASDNIALAPGTNSIEIQVTAQDGTTVLTYTLTVNRENPLPVSLASGLEMKRQAGGIQLGWTTASELNNSHFILYRGGKNGDFIEIGRLAGKQKSSSNQHYSYLDQRPLSGTNYYRLSQIDMDGTQAILSEKSIDFRLSTEAITLYPNPTSGKVIIAHTAGIYEKLEVFAIDGRKLLEQQISTTDNQSAVELGALASATYLLRLSGIGGVVYSRVIKK